MQDPSDPRLKRLVYRSKYTGTKELDVLLSRFVSRHLAELNDSQLDLYEHLLEAENPDLFMWISGRKPVPEEWDNEIMDLLKRSDARS
ncbi:MAG: succinate dehydrogenase assembly factor 2 [Alphaproteobacteria bacterium]